MTLYQTLRDGKRIALRTCQTCLLVVPMLVSSVHASFDVHKAVIHHTASGDVSAKEIDRWHRERGWDGIGYHFVIRKNGEVERGRRLFRKGSHAKGNKWVVDRNHYVGIVLTGYDSFTERQIRALKELLIYLKIEHIENHHQYCPGKGLDLKEIANELGIEFKEVR